eukprot:6198958-Prymnesium_polylepis.1
MSIKQGPLGLLVSRPRVIQATNSHQKSRYAPIRDDLPVGVGGRMGFGSGRSGRSVRRPGRAPVGRE